ncbi:hypothetical protein LTR36_002774 [Oleoguttula mirabilis]|uniref:Uncharacterized protein n=1 Tax=Oleoguttula mirabilis TaxID=1507867 RepID=A0AAV9JJK2_9PEZI|nr:hypothetical protein LTR36_002774 [Oleoguttula mirabilis]
MASTYNVLQSNRLAGPALSPADQIDSERFRHVIVDTYTRLLAAGAHETTTTDAIFEAWHGLMGIRAAHISYQRQRLDEWLEYCDFVAGSAAFLTTDTGFMGIGPDTVAENDLVALCHASAAPVILRPSFRESWEFGGFAVVKGVMSDELTAMLPDVELEDDEFVLV